MGKAARWLKGIFGMKREKGQHYEHSGSLGPSKNEKKATGKDEVSQSSTTSSSSVMASGHGWMGSFIADKEDEKIKHAIDVGIERLRSYNRGKLFCGSGEMYAAVMIQSFFRGYLARKALRALRGLVKLQALVRGYLVRKRVAATLHSMQAMVRAQAVARSQRIRHSTNKENIFYRDTRSRKQMQLFDETRNELYGKRLPIYSKTLSMNGFEERAKVVEVDTHTPHSRSRSITSAKSECGENLQYQTMASPLHCAVPGRVSVHECRNPQDMEWHFSLNERIFSTSQNTPRFADSMQPVKSVCGNTLFQHYSNFPNYMANTQSSKAKVRSHSAPKTRPPELKTRLSLNEIMAARNSISSVNRKYHYCFDKVV